VSAWAHGPVRLLDEEEVDEVRRRHREGWSAERIAFRYGVSRRTVYRYLSGPPTPLVARMLAAIRRWNALYALELTEREVDALAQALARILAAEP
jgi:transcriptional regulator with XRE-family HTH domain